MQHGFSVKHIAMWEWYHAYYVANCLEMEDLLYNAMCFDVCWDAFILSGFV